MPPKPRNRDYLSVYLLSIGLFVGIAVLALLVTRGYAVDLDSLTLQKRGVIVLRSDPGSAAISLDGKRLDKRTDTRLSLAPDTYDITVQAPERIPWQREIRLGPGEAVIQEIVLFPESPKRTDLTERPVVRFAASPDGNRIAAVVRDDGAARLQLLDVRDDERFDVRLNDTPRRVAVNDAGFVLAEYAERIAVYSPAGRQTAAVSGSQGGFAGDRFVFRQGRRVLETDRSGKDSRTLAVSPRDWVAAGRHVYVLGRTGAVTGLAAGRKGEPITGTGAVTGLAAAGGDAVQTVGRNGSFGIIREGTFKPIASGSGRATLSPDGTFVAYRTNREVRLFEWRTGTDRLVTSLTDPPDRVVALPGGQYVVYRRGGTLHAVARNGSNDRTVARQIASEPAVFSLDRVFATDGRTGRLVRVDLETPE
ncbi:MAG: hypothetical protein WD926_00250 [Patescibacteria group bacterium]